MPNSFKFFGFFLTLPMAFAVAQEEPAVMDPTAINDVAIIVSATRGWAQDPLDVPQAVSVLTDEDLNETVYSSLEDALHRLPNVGLAQAGMPFSANQGGNTSSNYWQEGFSVRGLGGPRVLVLTDGVRQAGQGIGYGGGNLALYDFYAIDRVEVLRGPASVLYGTDALGGVISVTTREPHHYHCFETHAKTRAAYDGSRNLMRTGIFLDAGDPNFAMVAGASFSEGKTPNAPHGTTSNGGAFRSYGGWMKADYRLCDTLTFRVLANITQVDDIEIANNRVIVPYIPQATLNINIPFYQRSELGVEIVGHDLCSTLEEAKLGLYWQGLRRHFDWSAPKFKTHPPSLLDASIVDQFTVDRLNTFEIQPSARFCLEPHTLIIGADIGYDGVYSREKQATSYLVNNPSAVSFYAPPYTKSKAYQVRTGLYVQDRWDIDPIELVLGGRFDAFHVHDELTNKSMNPTGFSGSASGIYHWTDCFSSYLTLATGFRAPDLGERFQQTLVVFAYPFKVNGNPALSPERSYSLEIGSKHRSEYIDFSCAAFANRINNYIGLLKSKTPRTFQFNNLSTVDLYGLEGEIAIFPIEGLEVYMGAGRTFSPQKKKIALPNWTVNFGTAYTLPWHWGPIASIKPEVRGMGGSRCVDTLNGNIVYPGYVVFDAQVSFEIEPLSMINGSIVVGIKNIFDTAYYTPFFGNPNEHFNAQPGRGLFTSIELTF